MSLGERFFSSFLVATRKELALSALARGEHLLQIKEESPYRMMLTHNMHTTGLQSGVTHFLGKPHLVTDFE